MEKNLNQKEMSELTSKVIGAVRFPLIVGVVFIHAVLSKGGVESAGDLSQYPVFNTIEYLFSKLLPSLSVPLFFIIAGYLFFVNMPDFTWDGFYGKLKSRVRTLLIPYLFWNLLAVATFALMLSLGGGVVSHPENFGTFPANMWSVGTQDNLLPVAGQFWFIRDLMVCVVFAPVLLLLVERTWHIGIVLLFAGWLVGYEIPGVTGFSSTALFFFTLGIWCARNGSRDLVSMFRSVKFLAYLWPVMLLAMLFWFERDTDQIVFRLFILVNIVFGMTVATYAVERWKWAPSALLSSSTFFVFGYHIMWGQSPLRKIILKVFRPDSELGLCVAYFGVFFLSVVIGVGLFYLLDRYFPRFAAIITGGRSRVRGGGKMQLINVLVQRVVDYRCFGGAYYCRNVV